MMRNLYHQMPSHTTGLPGLSERIVKPKIDPVIVALALFNVALHLAFFRNLEYIATSFSTFPWECTRHFGYATVPPLIGWVAWLMQNIFGYSVFAVRLFPALISGIMVFIVADLAKELGGNKFARILASAGIIIAPFGLRTFFLFHARSP